MAERNLLMIQLLTKKMIMVMILERKQNVVKQVLCPIQLSQIQNNLSVQEIGERRIFRLRIFIKTADIADFLLFKSNDAKKVSEQKTVMK